MTTPTALRLAAETTTNPQAYRLAAAEFRAVGMTTAAARCDERAEYYEGLMAHRPRKFYSRLDPVAVVLATPEKLAQMCDGEYSKPEHKAALEKLLTEGADTVATRPLCPSCASLPDYGGFGFCGTCGRVEVWGGKK